MIGYEKKTREWFSEKNAIIEKLQFEKSSTDIEKFALTEKLVNVSNQLINLQKLYNDNHRYILFEIIKIIPSLKN